MIYSLTCFVLRILLRVLFRYKAYGLENIPKDGSFILTSNHVSYLDPIAVGVFVKRDLSFVAKKELYEKKFFGWYMKKLRTIPMDRDTGLLGGMKEVIRSIRKGNPIAIFPEGTRSDSDTFLEPEKGAGFLASRFDLPVIPVYVKGTDSALPKGKRRITLCPITVYYGEPKRYRITADADKSDAYLKVSKDIMEEIRKLKERFK